ncbi:hypothetical protein F511_10236 [Dorcoceras hygrometricum]|uniref:Uncharacterized protein n=1 Tax=Dorcoceras hygrometricum TaxID=472368 RepID=A0A2Z7D4F0_9LAMI|nr:hypothetical protein F511_10236 [Dorcoceras hygrometricum]
MGTQLNVLSTRRGFREVRLPKSQQGSNRGFPLLRGKTGLFNRLPKMAVDSKIASEETVTSKYVVPLIDLSFDEEERLYGEARSCGRKTKLGNMGLHSPMRIQKVKRMKFFDDTKTPLKTTKLKNLGDKVNTNDGQKRRGPLAAIVIDISDDSSG